MDKAQLTKDTDRIHGCLFGGAAGDVIGGRCNGNLALSDDTQLTLATCEAIAERGGVVSPPAIAERFLYWHERHLVTGIGASTTKALSALARGSDWTESGDAGARAAGNGAAMRIAPLAFCLDPKESTAQKIIWDVTRITHRNEEAYAGALAVVFAVRAAWTGAWCGEDRLLSIVIDALQETALRSRLYEFTQLESLPLPEVGKRYGHSGYVVNSVPLALLGAQRIASLGFKGLIEEIVLTGGDTDTIASISGQIVGTLIGFQAIPQDIVALLPDQSLIERVAAMFSQSVLKKRIA